MNDLSNSPNTPAAPTNTMAIISLATGVASWVLLPLVGAIVAIVTGHIARGEIKRSGGLQDGDGLAIAGLVLGYLNLVTSCVLPLLIIFGILGVGGALSFCAILSEPSSVGAILGY